MADNWVRVAGSPEEIPFPESGILEVNVSGRSLCLIRFQNQIYACHTRCPHAGASLAKEGFISGNGHIVCAVHHYRFQLKNGRDAFNEGCFLKVYPVRHTSEGVFVNLKTR